MYLQITTKCNMTCGHCGFSCNKNGKHMDLQIFEKAIDYIKDYSDVITIGGGEPTLHPNFFHILKTCLENFDFVWFATNGSKTETMERIASIIDDEDLQYLIGNNEESQRDDETEYEYYERVDGMFYNEAINNPDGKLSVALSQDYYHDPIDQKIVDLWTKRASQNKFGSNNNGFEIRNVTQSYTGIANTGRAKRNGIGQSDHCVCPGMIIKPNGEIKACGCTKSPIIGDIFNGIYEDWQEKINSDEYRDTECYMDIVETCKTITFF